MGLGTYRLVGLGGENPGPSLTQETPRLARFDKRRSPLGLGLFLLEVGS